MNDDTDFEDEEVVDLPTNDIAKEELTEEIKPAVEPVFMVDVLTGKKETTVLVDKKEPTVIIQKEEENKVVPVEFKEIKRFNLKNRMSQQIVLSNGDIIPPRGTLIVKVKTEQIMNLEKRGHIFITEA